MTATMALPPEIEKWLENVGISSKALKRIRFGGVVGKQAIVGVAVALALAIVARQTTDPGVLRLCIGAIVLDCFVVIAAISFHGHKHPAEATLEGGEVVAWTHVQQEFAAKGVKELPASPQMLEGVGPKPLKAAAAEGAESKPSNSTNKGESI